MIVMHLGFFMNLYSLPLHVFTNKLYYLLIYVFYKLHVAEVSFNQLVIYCATSAAIKWSQVKQHHEKCTHDSTSVNGSPRLEK